MRGVLKYFDSFSLPIMNEFGQMPVIPFSLEPGPAHICPERAKQRWRKVSISGTQCQNNNPGWNPMPHYT
jgi:hypothetical protein